MRVSITGICAQAAAEAMAMLKRINRKNKSPRFLVDQRTLPQTLDVLQTRAGHFGYELVVGDPAIELGNGDIATGAVRAFEAGVIDVPFAPSIYNRGRMLPIRDHHGAIRIYQKGDIPLCKDVMDFHKDQINKRAKEEKREPCFQMVIDDIYAISKGRLVGRPTKGKGKK